MRYIIIQAKDQSLGSIGSIAHCLGYRPQTFQKEYGDLMPYSEDSNIVIQPGEILLVVKYDTVPELAPPWSVDEIWLCNGITWVLYYCKNTPSQKGLSEGGYWPMDYSIVPIRFLCLSS